MADDFNFEGRRCPCFDHHLLSLKDDSFRLFLRFHHHFHLKITEAETRSLNQQMKIDELEAQLSEAEEIIVDLREQLRQVLDQLEIAKEKHNSNKPLINESAPLDNEKSYLVNEYKISDQKSISRDPNSDGMVVNKCDQAVASTAGATISELNHYHVSKDGITSFVQPNREVYLYKNGCTERVCATESSPFVELCHPETGHTLDDFQSENRSEKSDNRQCPVIENEFITNNPIFFEERSSYADQSLVNLQSAKCLEKADNNSQNPVVDNDHISDDPILCEKLNNANQDQLKKADDNDHSGDKPYVGSYEEGKNEKESQNGLGEQVVHESGSYKAQESRSCRRSAGKNARYREAISALRRSSRKKPSRSWQKPLPRQHNMLSSGVSEESVEVPIEVIDKMPKTEVCGATKSKETSIPSDTLLADSNLVDVPIIDGSRDPHCSDNKGKSLKFTFYRKRRKNVLTDIDENIGSDRSAVKRKL